MTDVFCRRRSPALRRLCEALSLIACFAVFAGCSLTEQEDPMLSQGDGDRAELNQTGEMPSDPPVVRVNDAILDPLSYIWLVDGRVVRHTPENDDEIVVPQVTSGSSALVFEIGHPTRPDGLYVEFFAALDESNHPTEPGRHVDCTKDTEGCTVRVEPDHLLVTVLLEDGERMAVLTALYTVLPEVQEEYEDLPPFLSSSWGVVTT